MLPFQVFPVYRNKELERDKEVQHDLHARYLPQRGVVFGVGHLSREKHWHTGVSQRESHFLPGKTSGI